MRDTPPHAQYTPHVNSHENADLDSSDKRPKKDTQVKSMRTHIHTRVCTRRHVCTFVYVCVCGQGEGEKQWTEWAHW